MGMKHRRALVPGIIFFLCAFVCTADNVLASQDVSNMDASVGVNPVFTISANPSNLTFGNVDPGTTTQEKNLYVVCVTNNNMPWSVSMNVVSELTSGTFTIPNDNFNWWGWSTGSGTWNPGTSNLSTTPFVFYQAGPQDYITNPSVGINLTFNIDIPQSQAAGTYATTLILTMTE